MGCKNRAYFISRPHVVKGCQSWLWIFVFILCCNIFVLLVNVCICCVRFSFANTKPRDWLWRTFQKWPI